MDKEIKNDTTVCFDLSKILSEDELKNFRDQAKGKDLTEHFLDVTIRNKKEVA